GGAAVEDRDPFHRQVDLERLRRGVGDRDRLRRRLPVRCLVVGVVVGHERVLGDLVLWACRGIGRSIVGGPGAGGQDQPEYEGHDDRSTTAAKREHREHQDSVSTTNEKDSRRQLWATNTTPAGLCPCAGVCRTSTCEKPAASSMAVTTAASSTP